MSQHEIHIRQNPVPGAGRPGDIDELRRWLAG